MLNRILVNYVILWYELYLWTLFTFSFPSFLPFLRLTFTYTISYPLRWDWFCRVNRWINIYQYKITFRGMRRLLLYTLKGNPSINASSLLSVLGRSSNSINNNALVYHCSNFSYYSLPSKYKISLDRGRQTYSLQV